MPMALVPQAIALNGETGALANAAAVLSEVAVPGVIDGEKLSGGAGYRHKAEYKRSSVHANTRSNVAHAAGVLPFAISVMKNGGTGTCKPDTGIAEKCSLPERPTAPGAALNTTNVICRARQCLIRHFS